MENSQAVKSPDHGFSNQRLKTIGGSVLLIVLLAMLAIEHYNLHQASTDMSKSAAWIQPEEANQMHNMGSSIIGTGIWQTDFYQLESILGNMTILDDFGIQIDADTETQLQKISGVLGQNLSAQEWSRAELLIDKSYPPKTALKMISLIDNYLRYTQTYLTSREQIKSAEGLQKQRLLKVHRHNDKQQQLLFFGDEVAQKLFVKRNHTLDYFAQRQLINLDNTLNDQQKREQRALVERRYKNGLE
ncbi:hypothetical protein OAP14_08270 [Aliiglaciecola sp.]|nr:hypothetical protein [Aliiglaciecola sp.]